MTFSKKLFAFLCVATLSLQAVKEIELKISITKNQQSQLEQWLDKNAVFKGASKQTEYYLTDPNQPWDTSKGFKDARQTLRVRHEAKGDSFCYKYAHFDPRTGKRTHREEYETTVGNGAVILDILSSLGYTQRTPVSKTRLTYLVRNTFEVVLDTVEELGDFVEIELKTPTDDVQAGIQSIENLLREIGITSFIEHERGYIHMIWNPGYNFGTQRSLNAQ